MIDIGRFQFEIDVIVAQDNEEQVCPLILGRKFMATVLKLWSTWSKSKCS